MGADLYWEEKWVNEKRGHKYVALKTELCKLLKKQWDPGVTGPGDERGATDEEILASVRSLVAGN